MFRHAIVRPPAPNFADGLTTVDLGRPDVAKALAQHDAYCRALEESGLALTRLPADPHFPDSTFVEDTAVITVRGSAILTRPGAPSRSGEVVAIEEALASRFPRLLRIEAPGTVDGGDIDEAGEHFFIGVSRRTNEEGARQLARLLAADGYTSSLYDIRGVDEILHLKSGIAWLGGRHWSSSTRSPRIPRSPAGTSSASRGARSTPPTASWSTIPSSLRRASRFWSARCASAAIASPCSRCRSSRRWTADSPASRFGSDAGGRNPYVRPARAERGAGVPGSLGDQAGLPAEKRSNSSTSVRLPIASGILACRLSGTTSRTFPSPVEARPPACSTTSASG